MNVAFSLTLADPVLHQIPVLYKGSENSWGDGDTGIDLDMHPAVGDNFGDFLRVRGFPFGGGKSGCEIGTPPKDLLLSPPLELWNLISPNFRRESGWREGL